MLDHHPSSGSLLAPLKLALIVFLIGLIIAVAAGLYLRKTAETTTVTYRATGDNGGPATAAQIQTLCERLSKRIEIVGRDYSIQHFEFIPAEPGMVQLRLRSRKDVLPLLKEISLRYEASFHRAAEPDDPAASKSSDYEEAQIVRRRTGLSNPDHVVEKKEPILLERQPLLTIAEFISVEYHTQGLDLTPVVTMRLRDGDAATFRKITEDNLGKRIALVVAGKIVNAPKVVEVVPGPVIAFTSDYDFGEVRKLARLLQVGPLPCELKTTRIDVLRLRK